MPHATLNPRILLSMLLCVALPAAAEPPAADEGKPPQAEPTAPPVSEANEAAPAATAAPAASTADDINARMDALMDRMVQARTRLSALGDALYDTRIRITLDHRVEGFRVERLRLFLDGAPIHEGEGQGLSRGDEVELFTGFAAPGMHDLRLEVVHVSLDDGRYRYLLEQGFRFRAVEDQRTQLSLRVDDDSDIAEDFEDDQEGDYDVRTRLRVRAEPLKDR